MDLSEFMNIILGGGLVGTVATIGSLRATVRKAKAEAMKAEAGAEAMRIDNAEHASHIVYAGGVEKDGKTPKDTRTGCQKKALEKYVKDFHRKFPDVRIIGHNELAAKACPSFDVQEWLKEIGINQ